MGHPNLTDERLEKFKHKISKTQFDVCVVLENVHDKHNIGAVCRSCDAVGVRTLYILDTDPRLLNNQRRAGIASSTGVVKWLDIRHFTDLEACVKDIRANYDKIVGTHLSHESASLYDINFSEKLALVFGNEHMGITEELIAHCDANYIIPQFGMVQSLNISVACAVSLYELCRQRIKEQKYELTFDESNEVHTQTLERFIQVQLSPKPSNYKD